MSTFSPFCDPVYTIDARFEPDVLSTEPKAPQSLRRAGTNSSAMSGSFVTVPDRTIVEYDSNLEREWYLYFLQDPEVLTVGAQCVCTPYLDAEARERQHFWDLLVTYRNGRTELCEVKPLQVIISDSFLDDWPRIVAGIPGGTAHSVRLLSERGLDEAKVDTGALFSAALTNPRPPGAKLAYEFILSQPGPVSINQVSDFLRSITPVAEMEHFIALSSEYWAVVWLLAMRLVNLISHDVIGMSSMVAKP